MIGLLNTLSPREWLLVAIAVFSVVLIARLVWVKIRNRRRAMSGARAASRLAQRDRPTVSQPAAHAAAVHHEQVAPPVILQTSSAVPVLSTSKLHWADINSSLPQVEPAQTPVVSLADRQFGIATPLLAAFLPESGKRRDDTKRDLTQAGYYEPHAYENFSAARYLCIILPLLICGVALILVPRVFEPYMLGLLVLLPLLGWAVPRLYLRSQASHRRHEIELAMPDMLDMLNMCVSQGMTVPVALGRVAEELTYVHPALHKELKIVAEQARISSLEHALDNFKKRIDVPEVHSFCNLISQTERMGTSVTFALGEYSDNMRASIKQRADEKGNRAAFQLLFPTVLCLMPSVYLFLMGPSVIKLHEFLQRPDNTLNRANEIIRAGANGQR